MKLKVSNNKDFYTGVFFISVGLGSVLIARTYPMGTALRMGPGYFPLIVGSILILIGAIILFRSLAFGGPKMDKIYVKPLITLLGGVVIFGLLINPYGLLIATVFLTFLSRLGGHDFRLIEVILLTVFLTILVIGIFIFGLQLPINIGPW